MPDNRTIDGQRPRILHVSADVPDLVDPAKTPVIARLIDLVADEFHHSIVSINRKRPGLVQAAGVAAGAIAPVVEDRLHVIEHGVSLEYLAPAKGLLHATMLERLADWVVDRIAQTGPAPDLVVGHKLTIEGIVVRKVAGKLGIPFVVTIQGNTDQKILGYRPDLRGKFAQIYHEAACVFSFAPWARAAVDLRLGHRSGLTIDLPCPTEFETVRAPTPFGSGLISVFHLRNHRTKNLVGLAEAMRQLAAQGASAKLDIIGGGSNEEIAACGKIIGKAPNIRLVGPHSQQNLGPMMNGAIALVLPSLRESFGLVFIEALFAGLPIIYPKGAGVDGYFDGLPFAVAVDARDHHAIAAAIQHVIAQEAEIKAALGEWQARGGLERFSRAAIQARFAQGLRAAAATAANHGS